MSPLLGFTVFKDKILDGSKTQTIRKPRKHPIKVGNKLYLYWHPRQKDCEKLGETTCIEEFTIRLDREYFLGRYHLTIARFLDPKWKDMTFSEDGIDLIHRDGFKDSNEMLAFFSHYPLPEVFQVIRWTSIKALDEERL